jgi:hypothetical protein
VCARDVPSQPDQGERAGAGPDSDGRRRIDRSAVVSRSPGGSLPGTVEAPDPGRSATGASCSAGAGGKVCDRRHPASLAYDGGGRPASSRSPEGPGRASRPSPGRAAARPASRVLVARRWARARRPLRLCPELGWQGTGGRGVPSVPPAWLARTPAQGRVRRRSGGVTWARTQASGHGDSAHVEVRRATSAPPRPGSALRSARILRGHRATHWSGTPSEVLARGGDRPHPVAAWSSACAPGPRSQPALRGGSGISGQSKVPLEWRAAGPSDANGGPAASWRPNALDVGLGRGRPGDVAVCAPGGGRW